LEVRLAKDESEIVAAQRLRYRVFFEEMGAQATPEMAQLGLDVDEFDSICDHLLVIDGALPAEDSVVGTYRMLREEVANQNNGFYSASEYDLSALFDGRDAATLRDQGQFIEVGRSCVRADYRTNATIQYLWRGLAVYVREHNASHIFGCASLEGVDPQEHALALSYLHHNFQTPEDLHVSAVPSRHVAMNMMPAEDIRDRDAIRLLPPLIKGYLRVGCYIGDGAVVDKDFGTTDVFIIAPTARIPEKYFA
jgi:putative hemolysin